MPFTRQKKEKEYENPQRLLEHSSKKTFRSDSTENCRFARGQWLARVRARANPNRREFVCERGRNHAAAGTVEHAREFRRAWRFV